ncbi:hypothetical protein [Mycobacterium sp. OTB74]|uniref:hypothetical protein n=1 Tax=Mycobacterium sp. OTB74 TaxID=1853452 RepID=UPI0024743D91|nr:hypothetical protein [Mycobacterium sp. OTB74]MDH6245479.1 hypothetical protein [Mycobacterium sp. OTB74]
MLGTVLDRLAFTIIVNSPGPVTVMNSNGVTHPGIDCGPAKIICKSFVLATKTAQLDFAVPEEAGYSLDDVESDPKWICNPDFPRGKPGDYAYCTVSATSGVTVQVSPKWVPRPTPPHR